MVKKKTTAARERGRPPVHKEAWSRVTVILLKRQRKWLDRQSLAILYAGGDVVGRSGLIRAMIDAVTASGLNLAEAGNEAEVKAILGKKLGRKGPAKGK